MLDYIDGKTLKELFKGAYVYLSNKEEEINKLNVFPVPDGDTGSNMVYTLKFAVNESEKASDDINEILNNLSRGALLGAKGNSGVILSQIIRGFSKQLMDHEKISTKDFADALKNGSVTAYKAVMKPIEGTILTVSRECADEAIRLSRIKDFKPFFEGIVKAALKSLNRTPELLPLLKEAGVVDSGGKGFLTILTGMFEVIKGNNIDIIQSEVVDDVRLCINKDINYGYCTEVLVKSHKSMIYELREKIENLGDSLIVVSDNDLIKIHIHTNSPGIIIEEALKFGELIKVKIDNMKLQYEDTASIKGKPLKKYGILAVASGEGIKDIFNKLGCDIVIDGGQTMNPSTQDILKGIENINAENIIVFPNNKNVIMTCEQAMNMSKKNIYVIQTKSFNQAVSAIININYNDDVHDVVKKINETIENVQTIEITYSIRETQINDKVIKKGDILGFVNGKLIEIGNDYNKVAEKLINSMVAEETSIITIYYGNAVHKDDAQRLAEKIVFDGDIDIQNGGQPLYYYTISVE
ncbi:MAG: DAK2 domain-containing protein [Thermoanaerobacteraceae bacterium]|nr:DAK2 domain-containing protein [Thermoanaerobacteraceae bacterium]